MFAHRTNWDLKSNEIARCLENLKKSDVQIFDLTESNPTRCNFNYPPEKFLTPLNRTENLTYEPSAKGSLKTRESVSSYYKNFGISVDPNCIFLTASTSEAYSYIFRLLLNPNEAISVPSPSYPLFDFLTSISDIRLHRYPLIYDTKWKIDLNDLKKTIHKDSKAIVIVNPNNPTGSFIKKPELDELNQLAKTNKLALISDEVFADYSLSENKSLVKTLSGNKQVLTFTLSGLSKVVGLPQMKLSWLVVSGPDELLHSALERLELISDTYLSVNTPAQTSLPEWLSNRFVIQDQIMNRIRQNLHILHEVTTQLPFAETLAMEGGWYAVLKLRRIKNEEQFALTVLGEHHVLIYPGYFFDFPEEGYCVVSLLPETQIFREGLLRMVNNAKNG